MKKFAVVIEKGPNNYSAYVPDLPGCVSTGATLTEIEKNIREAIEFHIEGMIEDGDPIPEPSSQAFEVRSRSLDQQSPCCDMRRVRRPGARPFRICPAALPWAPAVAKWSY